jgi:Mg2+-importing ATPase
VKARRNESPDRVDYAKRLLDAARADSETVLAELETHVGGLSGQDAESRLKLFGANAIAQGKKQPPFLRLLLNFKNPLVLLLLALGMISLLTNDRRSAAVIFVMVILGVALRFFQELRADTASEKLQAMVSNTATAIRDGKDAEIPLGMLVPGDIVKLAAGDMVPADVLILSAKDLFVNQAALTGEALPVEKSAGTALPGVNNVLEIPRLGFLGSSVVSGAATATVVNTGKRTYLGSLAASIVGARAPTGFDIGIDKFTWLMIRIIAIMVPAVFLINGLRTRDWLESFLFATAVAVGLTPEMLPMIVTVNLSKGALAMSRKKVIVKRLDSIQNFGAMDILCTDKTGTLTQGKVVLEKHLDVYGDPSEKVLHYGYLNSYHHTGLRNILDQAILDHEELKDHLKVEEEYRKIDEIPFDFVRRRMSVVVEDKAGLNTLICKGAVDEVIGLCAKVEVKGEVIEILPERNAQRRKIADDLNGKGFRVLALAYKQMPGATDDPVYSVKDEGDLILLGFLAFYDPPKEDARESLDELGTLKVNVKVLTGDNEIITGYICKEVGIPVDRILLGSQIEPMSESELAAAADDASIFARLTPAHKERIIRALRSAGPHRRAGHVVGFLGDGINDAPALKAADVGITVDGAVDIAKESSDIILLENSLLVLKQGVLEGRRVFGNIVKYVKMAASSNFGNMLSVVGASAFLPFLPMLPIQVLTTNLLYDISQTAIPSDRVDEEWMEKPRQWSIRNILRFILCIGPISSLFDFLTFFILISVFGGWGNPELFHTGWFIESLITQSIIIQVIRTAKIPFLESRASLQLIISSLLAVAVGILLTVTPLAAAFGFVALPPLYWLYLAAIASGYMLLTQSVKALFIKKFGEG